MSRKVVRESVSVRIIHVLSTCITVLVCDSHCVLSAASKEEKPEGKDLLADLQDISDSERKTSSGESSVGKGF